MLAGAQVLLLSLIKWFTAHTGIEIKILLLKGGALLEEYNSLAPTLIWQDLLNTHPSKPGRKAILGNFAGKVNLIYGNTVLASAIYDELEFLKAPYVTHVHELEKSIRLYVDAGTIRKMREFTTGFVACSAPVCTNLVANHGISPEKIVTIHEFIEDRKINFNISREEQRKRLGLAANGLAVISCGTLYWRKGVDLFIETALLLKQKGLSDFHFYWIGSNFWDLDHASFSISSWKKLENRIRENELENHITFLGEKENVFDYLLACDLFYLPSREDPFPLACLEAAQCGLPVICFEEAGGMPDFVESDAGFIAGYEAVNEVADKIIYLDGHREILKKLGETARTKYHARHSIDRAAPELLSLCRKTGNFSPAVSVIVPNYNCEKYLDKRLDSILNQTFRDFELILLDDSSTDQSLAILEKYQGYPDVRLIKNQSNSGNPFSQWHKGFSAARGEIIWFAEADDFCEPEFLHKLLPAFNHSPVALSCCDSVIVDESSVVTGDYISYHHSLDLRHWKSTYQVTGIEEINFGLGVKNTIPNASAVLIRKSCISESFFDETLEYRFSGDWFFYTRVIRDQAIAFCPERINYHRKHNQTVTSKFNSEKSSLLLKEAEMIHDQVLDNYFIYPGFLDKWRFYISEQIRAFHPDASPSGFNRYYPYNRMEEKIKRAIANSHESKRLVFLTTNDGSANGGSEQLWRQAAIECQKRGHQVYVIIKKWDPEPFFLADLKTTGITVIFKEYEYFSQVISLKPDLMIFSLGDQDEGIEWYDRCIEAGIPYIIVNHLTKEPAYWPVRPGITDVVRKGYLHAKTVLFTGRNNHEVMERRLSCKIPNAGVFYNPFDVEKNTYIPFPGMDSGLQIAIVGSLLRIHKGQHLALELLNMPKWRNRPVHLNLYGEGIDEAVLKKQAGDYHLTNVTFHGHVSDILQVWRGNHALLLPSFMEGLPLVLVGAMICGRVPIVTDIGAHREVIDDNISGFIAREPTVEALDEALERAWQRSASWNLIGQEARKKILSMVPENPVDDFISKILPFALKSQHKE